MQAAYDRITIVLPALYILAASWIFMSVNQTNTDTHEDEVAEDSDEEDDSVISIIEIEIEINQ